MVRNRSIFAILCRLALAYVVAFQALFGALNGPVLAGAVDSSLSLCRGGEGSGLPTGGDHPMRADHCAVMCQTASGAGLLLAPEPSALNLAPGDGRGETLGPAVVVMPDGARDRAANARGPPRLG